MANPLVPGGDTPPTPSIIDKFEQAASRRNNDPSGIDFAIATQALFTLGKYNDHVRILERVTQIITAQAEEITGNFQKRAWHSDIRESLTKIEKWADLFHDLLRDEKSRPNRLPPPPGLDVLNAAEKSRRIATAFLENAAAIAGLPIKPPYKEEAQQAAAKLLKRGIQEKNYSRAASKYAGN